MEIYQLRFSKSYTAAVTFFIHYYKFQIFFYVYDILSFYIFTGHRYIELFLKSNTGLPGGNTGGGGWSNNDMGGGGMFFYKHNLYKLSFDLLKSSYTSVSDDK